MNKLGLYSSVWIMFVGCGTMEDILYSSILRNVPCFPIVNRVEWILLLPRKSDSRLHPQHTSWAICGSLPNFSPPHGHWSSSLKPSICWWTIYICLLGPCIYHVISMFNTCSRILTLWSLTDTDEGYNLRGAGFPHHSPCPSQPMVYFLSPNGPVWSQVNILNKNL
jgi:hypothetical protein